MKILSDSNSNPSRLVIRVILSLVVFFVANLLYPDVFETVGYMYNVSLEISYVNYSVGALFLIALLCATHFKCDILSHGFDIVVLGIYLPVAVVVAQTSMSVYYLSYPVISILSMVVSVRAFETTGLLKRLNGRGFGNISIERMRLFVFFPYAFVVMALFASSPSAIKFNLLDTYINTYDIRAESSGDGILGYFIGWFVLLFFPLFLSGGDAKLKIAAPSLAFLGAFYVFQTYAVKVIFLNFFLIAIFSYAYERRLYLYFPQIFFLVLFLVTFLFGGLVHPLIDRFFYLIGLTSIFYFDFFFSNPLRFFEGTKLDFGISGYGIEVGYLIDNVYYQGLGTNQSAGFLPTIYSDLGIFGVVVFSMFVGLIISLIKSIHTSSRRYSYLLIVAFAFALMNHPINMMFLSNGLIFVLFFALTLRRHKFRRSPNLNSVN